MTIEYALSAVLFAIAGAWLLWRVPRRRVRERNSRRARRAAVRDVLAERLAPINLKPGAPPVGPAEPSAPPAPVAPVAPAKPPQDRARWQDRRPTRRDVVTKEDERP